MTQPQHEPDELDVRHYRTVFGVLSDCEPATTVAQFRELLTESLTRRFRVGSATFFLGGSIQEACGDPEPLLNGFTRNLLDEYRERWFQTDLFRSQDTIGSFHSTDVASLQELDKLTRDSADYVRGWLYRSGISSATAMALDVAQGRKALVGLFDRDAQALGPGDLAALRLLARPLSRIAAALPEPEQTERGISLSPRHAEVAALISQGLSNRAIAEVLCLHEDSVKKYVSRILAITGCHNRTELALRVRSGDL